MGFTDADIDALWLTVRLATLVTIILLLLGTPLAWWLATTRSRWKGVVSAVVALPLVLPPTVLGFYFLIAMGPQGWIGALTQALGLGTLPFTFAGLVVASVLYSLPFVVQPIQNSMALLGQRTLEVAATLHAGPFDRFFSVVLPLSRGGILMGALLGFTHTVGEFGIVLMMGGSIQGETRVVSIQMYDYVESLHYPQAHLLAAVMVLFSFVALWTLYGAGRQHVSLLGRGQP